MRKELIDRGRVVGGRVGEFSLLADPHASSVKLKAFAVGGL